MNVEHDRDEDMEQQTRESAVNLLDQLNKERTGSHRGTLSYPLSSYDSDDPQHTDDNRFWFRFAAAMILWTISLLLLMMYLRVSDFL